MNENKLNGEIEIDLSNIPTLEEIRETKKTSDIYGDKALVCYVIGFIGFTLASALMDHTEISFALILFMLAAIVIAGMSLPLLRVTIKKRRKWKEMKDKRKEAKRIVSEKLKK